MCGKMALSAYILKKVEKDPFLKGNSCRKIS